jgi:predicted nucleotidyltransferase
VDHKRANLNKDKNDSKKNTKNIIDQNNPKEEKKDNEQPKEKITNYKQMNLKDILNLEFIPKKKIENKLINQTQTMKINNNQIAINNENKFDKANKNLFIKIKAETNFSEKEEKTDNINHSIDKEKFFHKLSNTNISLKRPSENAINAFSDYLRENINKANLTEREKETIMNSPITIENMQLINNLNLTNQNSAASNFINVSDLINFNESENLKNENSQDKNENDTDTAYSSSNQSETNNYNPENCEIPLLHDNSINLFKWNKINKNLNSKYNLINLKNNLRCHNSLKSISNVSKSGLTDVKNINNYLISPKKNNENSNLININLDSEFKNNFFKNKELNTIDKNAKDKFKKQADQHISNKEILPLAKKTNETILKTNETKDKNYNKTTEDSLNKKELALEGKAPNKIHFSLNPLANIYKLSNKNDDKEKNQNAENIESLENLKEDIENSTKKNINNENKYAKYKDAYHQEEYFNYNGNYNNKNLNKNDSNFNLNSPNSIKSDKPYFNANNKSDLYSNYYSHSASFGNIAYNPLYASGINPLTNSYSSINNTKSLYGGFNSPNNLKSKDFNFQQNFEKKNIETSSYNIPNKPETAKENNSTLENNKSNYDKSKEKGKESNEARNPNSLSESNKKTKNKLKKISTNLNISKDDSNLVNSKALNFSEICNVSQSEGNKKKISKLINSVTTGNYSTSAILNQNPQHQTNNNMQMYSNNINLIPSQAPVYQNYIPKNVNFRNFNFPVDMGNSFNLGFGHNFNNYNFFYPINFNNMGLMNMNMFGASAASTGGNGYYESNFYRKLNNDILEYSQKLEKNISLTKEIKSNVVLYLTEHIKEILDFLYIEVNIYGSFANDLSIECSDIDIIVKYEIKNDCEIFNLNGIQNNTIIDIDYIISYLTDAFNDIKCMEKVNPIYTASVPIIKLVIVFLINFTYSFFIKI